jgi:hypothetical protein
LLRLSLPLGEQLVEQDWWGMLEWLELALQQLLAQNFESQPIRSHLQPG